MQPTLEKQIQYHPQGMGPDSVIWFAFCRESDRFATLGSDRAVKLWNRSSFEHIKRMPTHSSEPLYGHFPVIDFLPGGKGLAYIGSDRKTHFWAIEAEGEARFVDVMLHHATFAICHDQHYIAIAGGTRQYQDDDYPLLTKDVMVFNLESGRPIATISLEEVQWIRRLAFAADGRTVYVASQAEGDTWHLACWDLQNDAIRWKHQNKMEDSDCPLMCLALSPNGSQVVFGNAGTLQLLDASTGDLVLDLGAKKNFAWVTSVSFSPDGKRLATGHAKRSSEPFNVWNLETGDIAFTKPDYDSYAVAFSPAGDVVIVSHENDLDMWRVG